jgi:L-ascorbate metabolism protein UlaG (beta-lactamase superfamily)
MHIEWYGQSAFRLQSNGTTVFIDPFGDMSMARERGLRWDYPAIEDVAADLLLVTHEHGDHNAVEAIGGDPVVIRSTAGTHASPIGDVIGIASEHDAVAGTERGPNTIYVFDLGGLRLAHFGDFGQSVLREEQAKAIGTVDLAFLPSAAGRRSTPRRPRTSPGRSAHAGWCRTTSAPRASTSSSRWTTSSPAPAAVHTLQETSFDTQSLPQSDGPIAVVPATP